MIQKNISETMKILEKKYPTSLTTLNNMRGNSDAFKILISCLLSLRTRDEITEVVSKNLFKIALLFRLINFFLSNIHKFWQVLANNKNYHRQTNENNNRENYIEHYILLNYYSLPLF